MMHPLFKWAAGALAVWVAYALVLFLIQRRILFPRHLIGSPPSARSLPADGQILWIHTGSGPVESWLLPPLRQADKLPWPVVIVAHGNGEIIDDLPEEMRPLREMGMGVLLVEYPGYGRSAGEPSLASIRTTFTAAYDALIERPEIDARRMVLFGRSLGGGAVCTLLGRRPAAGLVLVSTFARVTDFVRRLGVPGFLVRDPFDNLAALRGYPGPVLIFHGRNDETIPFDHGRRLRDAAPGARLVAYRCGHNDCPPDAALFWAEIRRFLEGAGVLETGARSP